MTTFISAAGKQRPLPLSPSLARPIASLTLAAAVSLLACMPASAQMAASSSSAEAQLQQLKQQIEDMRQQYEARLRALESQVQQAQAAQQKLAQQQATQQQAVAPGTSMGTAANASSRQGDNTFNPAVSLVLSGNYAHLSKDPDTVPWTVPGFNSLGEEAGPGGRGLNLGESEITFTANVDPWWYGSMTLAVTPENEAELEEAYVQSTGLSNGLALKAGRHFSGVGYLNEQHAHAWDFMGAPLAYEVFLDGQLGQDGAQLTWLAPTDQYLLLGAEVGKGASTGHRPGNRAVFARLGGDAGSSGSWRVGVSHLWQDTDRSWEDDTLGTTNAFKGKGKIWALDGVWKWVPEGATGTALKLQGEYFRRTEQGEAVADVEEVSGPATPGQYTGTQSGWYLQGVYQFMPKWKVGLRHDRLDSGTVDYGASGLTHVSAKPYRNSLMLDWSLSEFSRWRVQLNQDKVRQGINDTQVMLQYQMNLGAHGAHSF